MHSGRRSVWRESGRWRFGGRAVCLPMAEKSGPSFPFPVQPHVFSPPESLPGIRRLLPFQDHLLVDHRVRPGPPPRWVVGRECPLAPPHHLSDRVVSSLCLPWAQGVRDTDPVPHAHTSVDSSRANHRPLEPLSIAWPGTARCRVLLA